MFRFKQFIVHQDRCAMKVGTDGVLLGAWTNAELAKKVLDVGTGTGLLAMMLLQRYPLLALDAIEIDELACEQAIENVQNSPWKDKIRVFQTSYQNFASSEKYDLIVSNPPYFTDSLKNPDDKRALARHNDSLSLYELFSKSKEILTSQGKLSIIYPSKEAYEWILEAKKMGFHCTRLTKVIPKVGANEKRLLIEFSMQEDVCKEDELIIETYNRHEYSEQFIELTKDFYLKM
jgi:tRNA1Val (adenine37-N6)-methyltransferase